MEIINRIQSSRPDYHLLIVRKPEGWRPKNHFEVPRYKEIVSAFVVASYSEAYDDLQRCNRLALHKSLGTWAVIVPVCNRQPDAGRSDGSQA